MNVIEQKSSLKFSRIFRASRTRKGLSQTDIASRLNISQSLISKLEQGKVVPSVPVWDAICELLNIPPEAPKLGYVDLLSDIHHRNRCPTKDGTFRVAEKYSMRASSSIREALPLLSIFSRTHGTEELDKYLHLAGVDRQIFTFLDQPISPRFNLDLIKALIAKKTLSSKDLREVIPHIEHSLMHGSLDSKYKNAKTPEELTLILAKNIKKYDSSWEYHFDFKSAQSVELKCTLDPHLLGIKVFTSTDFNLLKKYRTNLLQGFFRRYSQKVKILGLESPHSEAFGFLLSFSGV